ncbi:unnamed protein product [Ilex paraguariensis]|uniref:Uncharacterized protein n=1 Tax=Ilex paraguariensis TaxID=185542 RepID=A0ABC8TXB3_9AQUA
MRIPEAANRERRWSSIDGVQSMEAANLADGLSKSMAERGVVWLEFNRWQREVESGWSSIDGVLKEEIHITDDVSRSLISHMFAKD